MKKLNSKREICLTKTGVIKIRGWDDTPIRVNSEDVCRELDDMISECRPKKDDDDNFAGRITIIVEMFGEFEDENER